MIRVSFLIRSLDRGGAERQLVALARALDPARFAVTILTFYPGGGLERELEGSAVELVSLDKRGRWDVPAFLRRAHREVARRRPHVLHGYLGIANEFAWMLGRAAGARVAWGIRSSAFDPAHYDWTFRATLRAGAALSRFVDAIIYNSHAGARFYRRSGYAPRREVVIPNGIDVEGFRRDEAGRLRVRAEWGVEAGERLVGVVGRIEAMKGQTVFLDAAAMLLDADPTYRFVCVGGGVPAFVDPLRERPAARRLGERLIWAGTRSDVTAVYSALDCLVLPSFSEGLPNVLAEAMACEVTCVTTDVGDAARVIGETGLVVPVGDAPAIAAACRRLLEEDTPGRAHRGRAARSRVETEYGLRQLVDRTSAELERLAARHG
jgi:glycosyltransferase involved in cell wall biosynthesis